MSKAPSFQFYPADWLNDIKLQSCSMAAQGVMINLMCLMHQSRRYGFLLINGSIPDHKTIIKLLRTHHKTFKKALSELLLCGALKKDGDGVLYCKRMVKDQEVREKRREAGRLGGNPVLLIQKDKQEVKQKSTPSSSSSFSSTSSDKQPKKNAKKKAPSPATGPPDEFPVTDRMKSYAASKGYIADLDDLTEAFLLHHRSKGTTFTDWHAGWQKWLRNQLDWYPERNVPKGQNPAPGIKPATYAQAQDAEKRHQSEMLKRIRQKRKEVNTRGQGAAVGKAAGAQLALPEP